MKIKKPTQAEYVKATYAAALDFCPPIYPCKKCGWPVIDGYCCTECGDTNPSSEIEES